jgi:hypothetical protein
MHEVAGSIPAMSTFDLTNACKLTQHMPANTTHACASVHFISYRRKIEKETDWQDISFGHRGRLAQLAARMLSMHEVAGSIPAMSIFLQVGSRIVYFWTFFAFAYSGRTHAVICAVNPNFFILHQQKPSKQNRTIEDFEFPARGVWRSL